MCNKRIFLCFTLLITSFICSGQNCTLTVDGVVYDEASESPLSYVNIFIQETQSGTTTDEEGNFILENICPGEYHFILSHIGCEGKKIHLDIDQDTTIRLALSHTTTTLGTFVIEGQKENFSKQANVAVNRLNIEDRANQNLSGMLENETGIHLIKNGNGISKPVVHGLYGNRLMILNNGILQSGQQWGNDHSPEIDPFAADKISVIKGASAIEYGGGNLGSVILSEPKRIEREPHLHGQINYIYDTNGRGQTVNARLEKYASLMPWRISGTLKKFGDKSSVDYLLNNTGLEEANLSIQLEKNWNENMFLDFYLSTFNTRLGILRGSHIGNLTDLEAALVSEVPFNTEDDFSYEIEAPKQHVSHHLAKTKLKYFVKKNQTLEFVLAGQLNDRKEFDVRRNDRSEIPALSLRQYTLNLDSKYSNYLNDDWVLKFGYQNILTDNSNDPETGILPLIPDYLSWKSGVFSTASGVVHNTFLNFGVRYDYEYQNALTISTTLPREVLRFENRFNNISALFAVKNEITKAHSISWKFGYTTRNPAINELYSSGLHQGVSGIEEGDINLSKEKALKNTLEYVWLANSKFSLNALMYHQRFKDYIFLEPQEELRLTIRGAFPVFKYRQTNASIYGIDISTQFTLNPSLFGLVKYSYIKGQDRGNDIPLIFMPPNSVYGSLTYRAQRNIKISEALRIEDSEIEITNRFVFEQTNILMDQDFTPPPPSYNLVGIKFSTNLILPKYKIRVFAKADNLFNIKYRDYLNRQRYFADDLGLSLSFGLNVKF